MFLIQYALRRPFTIMVAILGMVLCATFAYRTQKTDIFPSLNLPVIYVCQPYGGMDPAQMEGLLTNYYEYHFLYVSGIHHVESRNVQGVAVMKLFFHPGTNMSQAMAETISYVNRSRAFMPPGTVSPFVMRFDTGSVPVGYLVLSSEKRTLGEIQDLALFRIRPMFASVPGVSAPPPFGGSQRTVVVRVDPDRLRAYRVSPDDVITALASGNTISPSGNMRMGDQYPIVPVNALVRDIQTLGDISVRGDDGPPVYLRDLGVVEDAMDIPTGYALHNGRRAVYILVTKRAEASTLNVIQNVRKALPAMADAVAADDINVSFELDQSPYVTHAIADLGVEALLGAVLTGLMVLLFLRDWRSALVVVMNIPLALLSAYVALWITGQSINLMTLGGLALSVGILVDEATVEIENIHSQMARTPSLARAVRLGNAQTAVPRLLAMLCILAVFLPSFFMQGPAQALFVPLALAVGFAMFSSYILSSTFVPVMSVWLLRHVSHSDPAFHEGRWFGRFRNAYQTLVGGLVAARAVVIPVYLIAAAAVVGLVWNRLGMEIFPVSEANQFRLRLRAADGTHFDRTEQITLDVLDVIKEKVGADNVATSLGYVGMIPSSYPINAVYQWSRGPEEAILLVALKPDAHVNVHQLKEQLRAELAERMPDVRFSFEPSDIVNEVMSFGSPTPIDIAVVGANFGDTRAFAQKIYAELAKIDSLRDLQYAQSLDYPTIDVNIDRQKAGLAGVTASEISKSLLTATWSSRFVMPNYWPDPKSGVGYQVQVEIPQGVTKSLEDLEALPVKGYGQNQLLLRDVASVAPGTMPGQYDRYNMKRQISLTANIQGEDLAGVARRVQAAIAAAGDPPQGVTVDVRGQLPPMLEMIDGLTIGLGVAVAVIFLLLLANFQSVKLAVVAVSAVPAVIAGVLVMLLLTNTTLNIQSFMGAIMAIGVAMANSILLTTFSENRRRDGLASTAAAVDGAGSRLRAILMTSAAMIAGMTPMALGLGESGEQTAPLGRAVIGGLVASTLTTLLVVPCIFAVIQGRSTRESPSLDPDDPHSTNFDGIPPASAAEPVV